MNRPTQSSKYVYDAIIEDVYDADTVRLTVELGFDQARRRVALRLHGCNARELNEPGGIEARNFLRNLLPLGTRVLIRSIQNDKFGGRYNALLALPDGRDVVTLLIKAGYAAAWNGEGPRPVPAWPIPEKPAKGAE